VVPSGELWGRKMLSGKYYHNVDEKGRLSIPAKLRNVIGESYVICNGLDGCLFVYPLVEWNKLAEQIHNAPLMDNRARLMKRHFIGSMNDGVFDKQGRVMIPGPLREVAQIDKEVVLLGTYDKVEIWSKSVYEAMLEQQMSIEDAMSGLAEAGFSF